jgi:predicted transcriptional regulator
MGFRLAASRHRTAQDDARARAGAGMTDREIIEELNRIEGEMRAAVAKAEGATQQAMRIIEDLMADFGIPMAKESNHA